MSSMPKMSIAYSLCPAAHPDVVWAQASSLWQSLHQSIECRGSIIQVD